MIAVGSQLTVNYFLKDANYLILVCYRIHLIDQFEQSDRMKHLFCHPSIDYGILKNVRECYLKTATHSLYFLSYLFLLAYNESRACILTLVH